MAVTLGRAYNTKEYPFVEDGFYSRAQIYIHGDTVGLNGYATRKMKLIELRGDKILIRESGGTYWADRMTNKYAEPNYRMGKIKDGRYYEHKVIEYDKQTMKKAKELALQLFEEYCKSKGV